MARFLVMTGGARASREAAGRERVTRAAHGAVAEALPAARWPFRRHILPSVPDTPHTVWIPDLHRAFLSGQTPGTRLVLTQSTYQLQRWIDMLAANPHMIVVAHASRRGLGRSAPEAFAGRGPWSGIELVTLEGDEDDPDMPDPDPGIEELRAAFSADAEERLAVFTRATSSEPDNPALHLAVASAFTEMERLEQAQQSVDRALALAPDWEAPWFEYGKLWLRADDLERAAARFAEAARLMPSFSAALTNLGAALAETERAGAAIEALEQALQSDPAGYPILNNLAVIYREQGRLDEAISAGRRVIALAPEFVFGYYNLGHALFLQGRFSDAREMYEQGQRRDPQKNAVQACRLAVVRAAAGDIDRAIQELTALADALPDDVRSGVLDEAETILEALLQHGAGTPGGMSRVLDAVRAKKNRV